MQSGYKTPVPIPRSQRNLNPNLGRDGDSRLAIYHARGEWKSCLRREGHGAGLSLDLSFSFSSSAIRLALFPDSICPNTVAAGPTDANSARRCEHAEICTASALIFATANVFSL